MEQLNKLLDKKIAPSIPAGLWKAQAELRSPVKVNPVFFSTL
ncbi:hypothetical protein [Spirosoma agri]|nr:hypothetical protein [Spirosoma agri]